MLGLGDAAPDLDFRDEREGEVRLSTLWRAAPLVVVFLRHFG